MATEKLAVFKCDDCGFMAEVLHDCTCDCCSMSCCGKEMKLLVENTVDASKEKHVPVIEKQGEGILVKVGSVPHPMEEKHYIEWIEVIDGARVCRYHLKPGEAPQASFCVAAKPGLIVREYCNIHGLWKA